MEHQPNAQAAKHGGKPDQTHSCPVKIMGDKVAVNEASIYIDLTTIEQTKSISIHVKDKDVPAKELMDYLLKVKEKIENHG